MSDFALNAFLISALLTMSSSCSPSGSETKKFPSAEAMTKSRQQSEKEEQAAVTVVRFSNEPFALLRVGVSQKRRQMTLEVQNVSGKTVRLVTYGLGVSTSCSEFMYAMIPSPHIGYGDWTAAGITPIGSTEPAIQPQQKATIVIGPDKDLGDLLNPKTYRSCPDGHKKPELMLQNVYFDDGTEWRPNQQRSSK